MIDGAAGLPTEAESASLSTAQPRSGDAVWRDALEHLRIRVSPEGYETWLAPTRCITCTETALEIEVPFPFSADWLAQHYLSDIRAALAAVSGRDMTVTFRARQAEAPGLTQTGPGRQAAADGRVPSAGCRLQPRYTFDTFIVGEANRFACAAARNVAARPGRSFNPLFIYGGVGLGKTHLLHAIGNDAVLRHPGIRVHYTAAEALFIELIQAIERNTRVQFKNKYRGLDLLLLDDVHYLVGKERLQEEVFHIFNALHDSSSQVVFTSDRPAIDIPTLEERLASRLGSGLVVDIQPPDLETRIAILKQKAQAERVALPDETATYIASRVRTSIRALEGALVRLLAMASLDSAPLTVQAAEAALKDLIQPDRPLTPKVIVRAVAYHFELPEAEVRGTSRTKQTALARQVAMYLMRVLLGLSLKDIGFNLGGKDHTTVMHALARITRLRTEDPAFAARLDALGRTITGAKSG